MASPLPRLRHNFISSKAEKKKKKKKTVIVRSSFNDRTPLLSATGSRCVELGMVRVMGIVRS